MPFVILFISIVVAFVALIRIVFGFGKAFIVFALEVAFDFVAFFFAASQFIAKEDSEQDPKAIIHLLLCVAGFVNCFDGESKPRFLTIFALFL